MPRKRNAKTKLRKRSPEQITYHNIKQYYARKPDPKRVQALINFALNTVARKAPIIYAMGTEHTDLIRRFLFEAAPERYARQLQAREREYSKLLTQKYKGLDRQERRIVDTTIIWPKQSLRQLLRMIKEAKKTATQHSALEDYLDQLENYCLIQQEIEEAKTHFPKLI